MGEKEKSYLIKLIIKYGAYKVELSKEHSKELEREKDLVLSEIINIIKKM